MDPKEYARALRAALAMAEGDEKKAALDALAAKMEAEGDKPPPSERREGQAQRAAEPPPPPEKRDPPPAEQRAQVITLADVDARAQRASAEVLERHQLIADNRARMTDGTAALYARMPLADVKAHIAALPPLPPAPPAGGKKPEARAARVVVAPIVAPTEPAKAPEQVALEQRIDGLMGLAKPAHKPLEVDSRGIRISYIASQRAAATAAEGVS